MRLIKQNIPIAESQKINKTTKFKFKLPTEITQWDNGDVYVADHGYIDESGNIIFIGIVINGKKFYYASLKATGTLSENILEVDDTDNSVDAKEDIIQTIQKHLDELINKDQIENIDRHVRNFWPQLYEKYIEMFWC